MSEPVEQRTVAYCAPGQKASAAALLAKKHQWYDEIVEHPWMHGFAGVMLAKPAALTISWRDAELTRTDWDRIAQQWNGAWPWGTLTSSLVTSAVFRSAGA